MNDEEYLHGLYLNPARYDCLYFCPRFKNLLLKRRQ